MGAPDLSFEDEALQVLNGGGNDAGFDDEVSGLLASSPSSENQQRGAAIYSEPDPSIPPQPKPEDPGLIENLLARNAETERLNQQTAPTPDQMQGAGGALIGGLTHGVYSPWKEQQAQLPPVVRGVYDGVGQVVSPINKLAMAAPGATPLAAGARAGAVIGAEGGVRRAVNDPNATAGDIAGDTVRGAAGGFLFGAGTQGIANRLGGAADTAGEVADKARVRASGMPANQAADMTPAARAELAAKLEDPANGLITRPFQSPTGYLNNAKNLQARGQQGMAAAEDAVSAMPKQPNVPIGDVIAEQRARAAAERTLADPGNAGPAAFRQKFADNLQADTLRTAGSLPANDAQRFEMLAKGAQPVAYHSNELPWQRAVEQRRNIDKFTNWNPANIDESAQNAIRKEISGPLRGGIDNALNDPSVPPEVAQQWRQGRDAFSLGSDVRDASYKAIPNTGVPARAHEVPGFLARSGGMSAVAGAARAAQGGLGAAAEGTPQIAQQALQGWLSSKGVGHPANTQANSGSTGGVSGQRAEQALAVNPALLGKWAPQFEEAQRTGGSEAVRALITKLALNNTEFRTSPEYQRLSQGRQNGQ